MAQNPEKRLASDVRYHVYGMMETMENQALDHFRAGHAVPEIIAIVYARLRWLHDKLDAIETNGFPDVDTCVICASGDHK